MLRACTGMEPSGHARRWRRGTRVPDPTPSMTTDKNARRDRPCSDAHNASATINGSLRRNDDADHNSG